MKTCAIIWNAREYVASIAVGKAISQGLPLSENSLAGSKKEERRRERGEEDKEKERGRREEAGEGTSGALPLPWQFKPCSIWRAPLNYVSR